MTDKRRDKIPCTIEGCAKPQSANNMCAMHDWRVRKYGTTADRPRRTYPPKAACAIDGCADEVNAHGWCNMHAGRWYRNGDPLVTKNLTREPVEVRFWAKVDRRSDDDCWPWTAGRTTAGYGQFKNGNRAWLAHRFGYELLVGPIPYALTLDHLCRNRACVNPAHLEPVTLAENVSRARLGLRTAVCQKGHVRTAENTKVEPNGEGRTTQRCLDCRKANGRAA